MIFNEAIRHGRYDITPIKVIHQFREPPGRDRFLSVEEFQLLLAKCKDPELRTAILVLCMTTLRLRELLKRQWSEMHLDGSAPFVSVPHTKTGVPKKTPLPRVAVEALKSLPSFGVDDSVFPSRATARWPNPTKPYRWDLGKEFRKLVKSLGIEDVRIRDLRHTRTSKTRMLLSLKGKLAGWTGLEPATSDVTGRRSNQLNYHPARVGAGPLLEGILVGGTGFEPVTPGV